MSQPNGKGVLSTNSNPNENPNGVSCPAKFQKLMISPPFQTSSFSEEFSNPHGEGPSEFHSEVSLEKHTPANNNTNQQEGLNSKSAEDPFLCYEEIHVQDNINQCNNSLIGKILSKNQYLLKYYTTLWLEFGANLMV